MKRTSFAHWPCSVARTMDLLGDRWTPLVLREAFCGVRRFDGFQQGLRIARNTLSDRLRRLVDEGLLEKKLYTDEPPRYEYVLTEKGRDFYSVIVTMMRWGDTWLAGDEGVPVTLHHERCGQDAHAKVVCSACREPIRHTETTMRMGPGYPEHLRDRLESQRRFGTAESS